MFRTSFDTSSRLSTFFLNHQVYVRRRLPKWKSGELLSCASYLESLSTRANPSPSTTTRTFHSITSRPATTSSDFSNNLIHLYNTLPSRLPSHRIGLRFINSDSSNKHPPKDSRNDSSSSSSQSTETSKSYSPQSAVEGAIKMARDNPALQGLRKSVDSTYQEVRSKVNPRDLLYYFALLTVFGLLIVGPFAARQMRKSDTDYDDLDSEDPINDLATFVRTELLREAVDEQSSGSGSGEPGSKMGGLDTLIADLLRGPHIQDAINELVNKILTSPQFKRSCSILLKELWKDLVEDPETLKQVIHLLYNAIQDEAIKDAAVQLVTEVFADKEVLDEVVNLFQRLGQERKVQLATQELLVESAHNALNDPEILDHSMEFATDVVGDDVVQQTAGEALYNTLSYAVRPTLSVFLGLLGTGLIFVSLLAFQHSIAPESQSQSLDKALTAFEKSGLVNGLIKCVTFPWKAMVACKDAVFWLLMLPVRLVSGTLTELGKAGNATIETLNRCIHWLLNLPVRLTQSLLSFVGNGLSAMSDGLARESRQLGRSLSGSFLGTFFYNLADTLVALTEGFKHAWIVSNAIANNGALTVEALWRQTFTLFERGVTKTVAGWVATRSVIVSSSKSIRRGWASTNRNVGGAAVKFEVYIKVAGSKVVATIRGIEKLAARSGVSREIVRDVSRQTKAFTISSYHWLDRGALKIGLYLEGCIGFLTTAATERTRLFRSSI